MKIIDTNILSKFLSGEITSLVSGDIHTTEDLRSEFEITKSKFPGSWQKLRGAQFIEIESHRFFDESRYLACYRKFLNKYSNIVSFYGLKGMGDMSILSAVGTILTHPKPDLFTSPIEVVTHDSGLFVALNTEFKDQITISDPIKVIIKTA